MIKSLTCHIISIGALFTTSTQKSLKIWPKNLQTGQISVSFSASVLFRIVVIPFVLHAVIERQCVLSLSLVFFCDSNAEFCRASRTSKTWQPVRVQSSAVRGGTRDRPASCGALWTHFRASLSPPASCSASFLCSKMQLLLL